MNTLPNGQAVVRIVMALTLIVGGVMLTACSGQGGFSFDFGQGGGGGDGGTAMFSPMLILLLIVFLVAIIAVVALGALGKK
jgi:hypothetical protein